MVIEFKNVTISLRAKNGKEAYTALCNALATLRDVSYLTDSYTIYRKDTASEKRPTTNLFPK